MMKAIRFQFFYTARVVSLVFIEHKILNFFVEDRYPAKTIHMNV